MLHVGSNIDIIVYVWWCGVIGLVYMCVVVWGYWMDVYWWCVEYVLYELLHMFTHYKTVITPLKNRNWTLGAHRKGESHLLVQQGCARRIACSMQLPVNS